VSTDRDFKSNAPPARVPGSAASAPAIEKAEQHCVDFYAAGRGAEALADSRARGEYHLD
jgi:hypothetical protein